ncbi:MAG TPA: sialidase family protein, partial [Sulfurovum sp.]
VFAQNAADTNESAVQDEEYIAPPQVCYQFKKEDFNHTSKTADDLIIDITSKEYIGYKSSSSRQSYNSDIKYFGCVDNQPGHYDCSRWDSIEKMRYYIQDDVMYLHVDYIQIPMEDDSIIHHIRSKDKHFAKGSLTPCHLSMDPVIAVENIKKDTPKDHLLQSITIKDVIIYDLDYYKDLVIAVGEDNSPRTRELQSRNEHYESVILRSKNGGKEWERVGQRMNVPHNHVIVLDDQQIIIASSTEGFGGELMLSSDGGNSWKTTYSGGMIETLKQSDGDIIFTDTTGSVFKSKDSGKSWTETVSVQHEQNKQETEAQTEQISGTEPPLSMLQQPEYRIDYENNTLIVKQSKNSCTELSLSLVYNQSNRRDSILGPYWSLASIESQITPVNKDELFFFDSYRGKVKHYSRDKNIQKFFYHKGSNKIEETKDGYVIKCDRTSHHFDTNGSLTEIRYKDRTYSLHYQNNSLHQIMENTKDSKRPYLSFSYPYEGVSITLHDTKEEKTVTFIKNNEKLLSSIVQGDRHLYHYTYREESQGNHELLQIEDMSKSYAHRTLLKFEVDFYNSDILNVYDFRKQKDGYTTEKKYYHFAKEKEQMCIINTLTKYLDNETLTDVSSNIDMYHFEYFDKDKKRLAFTRHGKQTYGFDEIGRVNFYGDDDGNISVTYSQFNKIDSSLVYQADQSFQYRYYYTDDSKHHLQKVVAPHEELTLSYDKDGLIKELKTKKYHLQLEYDEHKMTKRIIMPHRGEIITNYDAQSGELTDIDTHSYDQNITGLTLMDEMSRALQTLKEKVSEGSIKKYPPWLW